MTHSESDSELLRAMAAAGLQMARPNIVADGNIHRERAEGDKAGSSNLWYVSHGDYGAFGSWRTGQSETWTRSTFKAATPAERKALAARMAEIKAVRDAEQAAVRAAARVRAAKLWDRGRPASNDHPYLTKKRVGAYGVRDLRGQLVIPMRDAGGTLHSLQFIGADGRKTYLTGGRKRGCYFAIGRPGAAICICEGYATAATVFEATGQATACAFDAGNLEPVARSLRGKFPDARITICADDDAETPGNPGISHAEAAARAVHGYLAVPVFTERAQ